VAIFNACSISGVKPTDISDLIFAVIFFASVILGAALVIPGADCA